MAKNKTAFDRVEFVMMDKDIDVLKLANQLLYGTPLIVNFESFNEVEANKVITFLSGVTFAIDGEIEEIREKVKSVKYSVLYMKAIKALQEAMDRIETLEATVTTLTARIETLEG